MDPTKILIAELRNRIDAYFAIVLRNVRDSVPKAVGHFLVRATQVSIYSFVSDQTINIGYLKGQSPIFPIQSY